MDEPATADIDTPRSYIQRDIWGWRLALTVRGRHPCFRGHDVSDRQTTKHLQPPRDDANRFSRDVHAVHAVRRLDHTWCIPDRSRSIAGSSVL